MPYRIDLPNPPDEAFDRLVDLGALDVEPGANGIAAIIPDDVPPATLARALGVPGITPVPALGRDDGSVWVVRPRAIHVAGVQIVPADWPERERAVRLIDSAAFGTGLHPTTVLALEALGLELQAGVPASLLDAGTGSGVLALAALRAGVPRAVAIDIDDVAVHAAVENARLNGLLPRLRVVRCGPDGLCGSWPLVMANILAAPLIELAPVLAQRVARRGRIVLSGIRSSLADDVERAYRRPGMRQVRRDDRDGWTALTFHASW